MKRLRPLRRTVPYAVAIGMPALVLTFLLLPPVVSAPPQVKVERDDKKNRLLVDKVEVASTDLPIENPIAVELPDDHIKLVTWSMNPNDKEDGRSYAYSIKLRDKAWTTPKRTTYHIRLKNRDFDPLHDDKANFHNIPIALRRKEGGELYLVQFTTQILQEYRKEIQKLGGTVHTYFPELTHVVRMKMDVKKKVEKLPYVRWVGPLQPYYKVHRRILDSFTVNRTVKSRYLILAVSKESQKEIVEKLKTLKIPLTEPGTGTDLLGAELTPEQVVLLAAEDTVLWIEYATKPGKDMDNARKQGGADYLEKLPANYTGIGIRGHVLEGIHKDHPDFKANANRLAPIAVNDDTPDTHGTNSYGQIFGDGSGMDPKARGMLPNAQGFFTNSSYVYDATPGSMAQGSRYELVGRLIKDHKVMFQTASWGYEMTTEYDLRSKEMDDLIFDHDIPITQSQSNSGEQASRPQAWAKNVISVGGAYHFNTADSSDDRWNNGASTGPAEQGRVKPDLCAYYDQINTTDGPNGYISNFGGTSGATPIIAGHVGLCLEMWTNGVFGNKLPMPATSTNRFENRPHATTVKALLICSAKQYPFPPKTDMDRYRQGWGFPDLEMLHKLRDKAIVINQTDVLQNLESKIYEVTVAKDQPMLRVTMTWADPGGPVPTAGPYQINDLDLKVTDPDGVVYWGNNGLLQGPFSSAGGEANQVDTVENVFIDKPRAGVWKVEVIASNLNADGHPATAQLDAVYALVILGVTPQKTK